LIKLSESAIDYNKTNLVGDISTMETITLNLPATVALTDEQFYQLCIANEEWRLEQTPEGELIIMPPTGGESGIRNSDLTTDPKFVESSDSIGKSL